MLDYVTSRRLTYEPRSSDDYIAYEQLGGIQERMSSCLE